MANLRDLGGLATADGRTVARGRLFRSEVPVVDGAVDDVLKLGVETVVDLRRPEEVSSLRPQWPASVTWRSCPVIAGNESPWRAGYDLYLGTDTTGLVGAINAISDPNNHPVLFHCASGRDRTGVVASIVLSLLGVRREEIIADYVATATGIGTVLDRLALTEAYGATLAGWTVDDHTPRRERIVDLLDWFEIRGGVQAWVGGRGISTAQLDLFRDALLV